MDAIIGDLLGDGHIRLISTMKDRYINKGRMEFTFSVNNLSYLRYLKFVVYKELCTLNEPTP